MRGTTRFHEYRKGKGQDDDEVFLDFSGDEMEGYHNNADIDEVDPLFENGDNNLGTMEFDVDNEVADAAGLTFLRQVHPTPGRTTTNNLLQLDNYIAELYNYKSCLHCSHGCDCKTNNMKEWLIDSGASEHFTYDIVRATLPYCFQCDSASSFGQTSPTSHFW